MNASREVAGRSIMLGALLLGSAACGDDGVGTGGPPGGEGPAGPEGPQGPSGNPADPSIGGVSPAWAWLSRSASVTISGYNTDWDDRTTVDFGPGITVNEVVVANPTSIVADITVEDGADLGAHDVAVTAGGDALTASGAFDVREGLAAEVLIGDGTQGSFNLVVLQLEDPAHPVVGGEFTNPDGANFMHTLGGAGSEQSPLFPVVDLAAYEPHFAIVQFFVDPLAPADAPISLVTNAPFAEPVVSTGRLAVAPKTPVALSLDTPETVTYGATALATHLFEYSNDSGDDQIVTLNVSPGSGGQPMVFRYAGSSGRMRDGIYTTSTALRVGVRDGESVFMMAVSAGPATGFTFDAEVNNAATAAFYASQETDDDECENAQDTGIALAVGIDGFVIDQGVVDPSRYEALEILGESDWYRISLDDAGGLSCNGHGNHDIVAVEVYSVNDCETPLDPSLLAAGDYVIRIAPARLFTMRGSDRYSLVCGAAYL